MQEVLAMPFGCRTKQGSHDQQNCERYRNVTVERVGYRWQDVAKKKWKSFRNDHGGKCLDDRKITIERYGERQKREYPKRPGGSHDFLKPLSWMIKIVCFDGEE